MNIAHCHSTKDVIIIGYQFIHKELFFNKPIKSSKLDIYIVHNLSKTLKFWKISDIKKKLMLFPAIEKQNYYVAFPILHS